MSPARAKRATVRKSYSPHPLEGAVDGGQVKGLWVEGTTDPVDEFGMLFVVGIANGLEEVTIAVGAPTVFGWTGSLAFDARGELEDQRNGILDSTTTSCRQESPKSYS